MFSYAKNLVPNSKMFDPAAAAAADPKKLFEWGLLLRDSAERLQFQENLLYATSILQILSLTGCAVAARQLFLKRGSSPQIDKLPASSEIKTEE
jgi:hypothetical protein